MGIYGGSIDLMKIQEIDNADELERFARESKQGNGVLIGAYDGLTLAQSAKEIRVLRDQGKSNMTPTAQELIRIIREMTPAEKTQLGQVLSDIGVSVVITKRLGTATPLDETSKDDSIPRKTPTVLTGPRRGPWTNKDENHE